MNARAQFAAAPQRVDSGRFAGLAAALGGVVAQGLLPGVVAHVTQAGRTELFDWWGQAEPGHAMDGDAIFWIASMTKPVTSVAAMLLVEAGALHLQDPVADYLPAFGHLRLADGSAPRQPPRVLDLLRHTAGFTYGAFGSSQVHAGYERERVYDFTQTNAQMADKLARLPLLHEPGTTFEYGMSTDVLGRVIEVCSGEPLDEFMARRIFAPLSMHDTGFAVPPSLLPRVARPFAHVPFGRAPPPHASASGRWGGGGLWSTARDYGRFARMLLQGGELEGTRVLSPRMVARMLRPHLPAGVRFGDYTSVLGPIAPTPEMGQDFGLGLSLRVDADRNPLPGSVGDFSWPGVSGALFWCDPRHALAVVVMLQAPSLRLRCRALCRESVYADLAREQSQ